MELKDSYEALIKDQKGKSGARDKCVSRLMNTLRPVAEYDRVMTSLVPGTTITVRQLVGRLLEMPGTVPDLPEAQAERIPPFGKVEKAEQELREFADRIHRIQPDGVLSRHPLALLKPDLTEHAHPVNFVSGVVSSCLGDIPDQGPLSRLNNQLQELVPVDEVLESWEEIRDAIRFAESVRFLAEADQLKLSDSQSKEQKALAKSVKKLEKWDKAITKAQKKNKHWRTRLSADDTSIALAQAQAFEHSLTRFFSPAYWRLNKLMKSAYDFSAHTVTPSWVQVLSQLNEEHDTRSDRTEAVTEIQEQLEITTEFGEFHEQLLSFRESLKQEPATHRQLLEGLRSDDQGAETMMALAELADDFDSLELELSSLLQGFQHLAIPDLREHLIAIRDSIDTLPDYLHCCASIQQVDSQVNRALRTLPLSVSEPQVLSAQRTLDRIFTEERDVQEYNVDARDTHLSRVNEAFQELEQRNAVEVRQSVQTRFHDNVRLCSTPAAQLTPEQKALKKVYSAGRRGLEHDTLRQRHQPRLFRSHHPRIPLALSLTPLIHRDRQACPSGRCIFLQHTTLLCSKSCRRLLCIVFSRDDLS